jgi:hypothetical protein
MECNRQDVRRNLGESSLDEGRAFIVESARRNQPKLETLFPDLRNSETAAQAYGKLESGDKSGMIPNGNM